MLLKLLQATRFLILYWRHEKSLSMTSVCLYLYSGEDLGESFLRDHILRYKFSVRHYLRPCVISVCLLKVSDFELWTMKYDRYIFSDGYYWDEVRYSANSDANNFRLRAHHSLYLILELWYTVYTVIFKLIACLRY